MRKISLLLLTTLFSLPALAESHKVGNFATYYNSVRVQNVTYQPNLVVKVSGFKNNPTVIEFSPSEKVLDVAGGGLVNWDVAKVGNRVFIVPQTGARSGTMIIATNKRSYVFDLSMGSGSLRNRVSKISFNYPDTREDTTNPDAPISGPRNHNYTMQIVDGSENIKPIEAFDDGKFTYFKFPVYSSIPVIYKANLGQKDEWLVNYHKSGPYIVVEGISAQWNLRLNEGVIGVFNESYDPNGGGVQ